MKPEKFNQVCEVVDAVNEHRLECFALQVTQKSTCAEIRPIFDNTIYGAQTLIIDLYKLGFLCYIDTDQYHRVRIMVCD